MDKETIQHILIEYLQKTIEKVHTVAAQWGGRKILGPVIERPDDVEIEIDRLRHARISLELLRDYHAHRDFATSVPAGQRVGASASQRYAYCVAARSSPSK